MDAATIMNASHLMSELQASRERLFAPLRGLTEEQFRHVPPGEGWSIATHLAHLLRVERLFVARAAAALQEDEPRMLSTGVSNDDDPALAQRLAVPQIVHGLQAVRRGLDGILARCDESMLDRAIVHERLGRVTIVQIAAKLTEHEQEHADAVERLAKIAPAARRVIIPLTQRS